MGTLRFVLALFVLWFHLIALQNNFSLNGLIAVDSFFIISGFYIALILNSKYIHSNYWVYITNRFLRIYPLYWILYVATFAFIFLTHYSANITNLMKYFTIQYPEFSLLIKEMTLIIPRGFLTIYPMHQPIVAPAWSLVIEVMFYIIAPFFVRKKLWIILVILIASFIIRYFIALDQIHMNKGYLLGFFPANMGFFAMGILAYRLFEKKIFIKGKRIFFGLITFLLVQMILWRYIPDTSLASIPLKEVVFFLNVFIIIPTLFQRTQRLSFDRFLGDLSYPVYISHVLIVEFLLYVKFDKYNYFLFLISSVLLVMFVSYLLYKLVDRPLNAFRQKRIDYST